MTDNEIINHALCAQVIFVSHSGGKDSQAMLARLIRLGLKDKIVLVHSDLGEMEWEEMKPWIEKNSFGLPVHVVKAEMDFFSLVRKYKRLPSSKPQFCTDFLKTKPIEKFIHDYMYKHGYTVGINATGMRAKESKRRAEKIPFTLSKGKHTSGMHKTRKYKEHTIFDMMPIFEYDYNDVVSEIHQAGQQLHWIYSQGFSRLSCVYCVNGRKSEHEMAAKMRPKLARKIADLEREIGKTYRLKQKNKVKINHYMDEYLSLCN